MKNTYVVAMMLVLAVLGILFWSLSTPEVDNSPLQNETENVGGADQSGSDTVAVPPVKEFTVTGENFSFSPNLITVKKGDRVKITFNNSAGFHDFKIDEYGVATNKAQAPATEVLEFTADRAGSFEYYCSVGTHRAQGMVGVLRVEE